MPTTCPPEKKLLLNKHGVKKCYVRCKSNQRRNRDTMRCNKMDKSLQYATSSSYNSKHVLPEWGMSSASSSPNIIGPRKRRVVRSSSSKKQTPQSHRSRVTPQQTCPDGRDLVVADGAGRCFKKCDTGYKRFAKTHRCRKIRGKRKPVHTLKKSSSRHSPRKSSRSLVPISNSNNYEDIAEIVTDTSSSKPGLFNMFGLLKTKKDKYISGSSADHEYTSGTVHSNPAIYFQTEGNSKNKKKSPKKWSSFESGL